MFMLHIIRIESQFENIIKNGPFIPMVAGQRKPEGQWTGDERKAANLDQRLKSLIMFVLPDDQMNSIINCLTAKSTWDDLILYKALMNELVNDGIKLSKLEINIGFINGLPKKWLSFCQSLRNTNHVKDSELASLFGKLKYEENLIDSIYETEKNKSLVSATPLSTAFISTSIVQDFQDSPDDEEDTRSSHEYLNDLEEEYQARALLAKSKRFFKKGTQRFSSAKATDQTECHKCGKKELRPTKDFEAKYNKVKAKLALLSSSASALKAATVKNKGLIAEAYEWDEEEVSSDDNEMVEVKVLMALAEENDAISKEGARNGEWVKISMRKVHTLLEMEDNDDRKTYLDYLSDDTKVSIPGVERPWLSEAEGFILPNHDTATDYESADESSVCSTPLPPLNKVDGVKPVSRPKTIKSILRLKSTFKAESLKCVIINESTSALTKSTPAVVTLTSSSNNHNWHLKSLGRSSYDHETNGHNRIISLEREINSRNSQHAFKRCEAYGSSTHTITDYDIEWFRRGEALQAKKAEALKSTKAESSNANRSRLSLKGPKVVFGDDSICTTEGYGSIKQYDEKADDGDFLGYSLVSKALRVFNTRRQKTKETYHITYQTNNNDVSFIEPYESPEPVVLEIEVSSDQNGQADQNDQSPQTDEILNDDQSEHSNHTNDEKIIDNLQNTKDIQIFEPLSSLNEEDNLIHDTTLIHNPSLSIPSMTSLAPQDRWS
ncbi:hypothetical protein Tco_1468563 [Tanacetum coccineum]